MRHLAAAAILLLVVGCATPVTMLRHPTTGQVARCGGGVAGSIAAAEWSEREVNKMAAACVRRESEPA